MSQLSSLPLFRSLRLPSLRLSGTLLFSLCLACEMTALAQEVRIQSLVIDPNVATSPGSGATMTLQASSAVSILRLQPPTASWEWQIANPDPAADRTQMELTSGNELRLFSSADDQNPSLILRPGTATGNVVSTTACAPNCFGAYSAR